MVNTELLTRARAPRRARARVGTSVLSTIEKSTFPSASFKGHRKFKFSFWIYMAAFLFWSIQNSSARARVRAAARARARARARVGTSVLSTIEKSTFPSAS